MSTRRRSLSGRSSLRGGRKCLEETFALVSFTSLLSNFGRDVLEEDFLENIVEGDRAE